jgi:hypothetical protein
VEKRVQLPQESIATGKTSGQRMAPQGEESRLEGNLASCARTLPT